MESMSAEYCTVQERRADAIQEGRCLCLHLSDKNSVGDVSDGVCGRGGLGVHW